VHRHTVKRFSKEDLDYSQEMTDLLLPEKHTKGKIILQI
jgi:hypothetical protein